MRAVAAERGEDEELWGVTGLLHDMDYERFPDLETGHPRHAIAEPERRDADPAIIQAIVAHASYLGVAPESDLDRALLAVEELSGFVVVVAQVRPEGIHGMTPKSIKKKLKAPAFAAAVSREDVARGPRAARDRARRAHPAGHRRPRGRGRRARAARRRGRLRGAAESDARLRAQRRSRRPGEGRVRTWPRPASATLNVGSCEDRPPAHPTRQRPPASAHSVACSTPQNASPMRRGPRWRTSRTRP